MHAIVDEGILEAFIKDKIKDPLPQEYVEDNPIYKSRRFGPPDDFGRIILRDFGTVVNGELKRNRDARPNIYRSPEVILETPWSYPVDIWNVGAMI